MITGRAIDPNVTPLFRGIELRTLSLTWDLIPRTAADSAAAASIVKTLRTQILPAVEGSFANSVLSFPSAFGLAYSVNGTINPSTLPDLSASDRTPYNWMCESFNVSYNGGAPWSNFINGEPTQITITMGFREMIKKVRGTTGVSGAGAQLSKAKEASQTSDTGALEGTQ